METFFKIIYFIIVTYVFIYISYEKKNEINVRIYFYN